MRTPLLVLYFLLTFASLVAQHNDESLIRQSRALSNQAIALHDTASLAQFWTEDVHVTTSRSFTLQGKMENKAAFQREFNERTDLVYIRTPSKVEVFYPWSMASEYGTWEGSWKMGGVAYRVGGSYYAKWHQVGSVWKIRAEIFVPTHCNGGAFCDSWQAAPRAAIVVQNLYFPKPGKELEVLAWRLKASSVRAKLGLREGRVLKNSAAGTGHPFVVWECEYPSLQAREEEVAALDRSSEFKQVQDHMSTLLDKFDRIVLEVVKP